MKIPINIPFVGREEISVVTSILKNGALTSASNQGGKHVQAFEKSVSSFVNAKYTVAVNSGTAALQAALYALDIKHGDEVLIPSFTFVATANSLNLPKALIDRMEIIHLSGYTEDEKLEIAKRHLISKQMKNNGVKSSEIIFKDSAIMDIIRYYTREAGVRSLDREIGSICRKVIKDITLKKRKARAIINSKSLPKFLGMKKYRFGLAEEHNQIGEVTGLAWTSVGGDLLTIEASSYKGKGKLNYTGQLGDVMKESIQAAMSVTRLRAESLGIADDFHEKLDIHIHVPDGSTPKDGPSAGAAMCTALVSVLTGRKVKAAVAMTGEITLRGEITPIGGLKEKLLAAMRGGIQTVIIPEDNERELSEVPEKIKSKLEIIKVKWIDQVLDIALEEK